MPCLHCYHQSLKHTARPGFVAVQCCDCEEVKEIKKGHWTPRPHLVAKKGAEA